MDVQREIDFSTRGGRLRLLDKVQLPKLPKTTPATMLAVLRCIDGHARDKATARLFAETIANEIGRSRAAVDRACKALESLHLLHIKRTGGASVFRIGWANLVDHDPAASAHDDDSPSAHDDDSDSSPCGNGVRTVTTPIPHGDDSHIEALVETPPPPPSEAREWEEVEASLRDEFQIGTWPECLAACRERGENAAAVSSVVDEFRSDPRWRDPAGALAFRLLRGVAPDPLRTPGARQRADALLIRGGKIFERADTALRWIAFAVALAETEQQITRDDVARIVAADCFERAALQLLEERAAACTVDAVRERLAAYGVEWKPWWEKPCTTKL